MINVLALCNLHSDPSLGPLTESRPLGPVSFLGRYGLMDFTLSNFANSGISKIGVLCEKMQHSVASHVRNGSIWIDNTKTGYFDIIYNERGIIEKKFNTDIQNLRVNKSMFDDVKADIVVVAPAFFIANVDFRPIIDEHIKNGNEITVVYSPRKDASKDFFNCDSLTINPKSQTIRGVTHNLGQKAEADISLETFVFTADAFERLVKDSLNVSRLYGIRNMVNHYIKEHIYKVHAYKFEGVVVPILSMESYVKYSLKLLKYSERKKLFKDSWPIFTTSHNTPPSLYGKNANVRNSFIANGSIIKGTVENSIISRNVIIEEGAVVKNSILFTKAYVGRNVHVENVVADKMAQIKQCQNVKGKADDVLYINQGAKV